MANTNDGTILSFSHGGRMTITPEGGSALVVLNILAGTFSWRPTMFSSLTPDLESGVLLDDIREGDEIPGGFGCSFKYVSAVGADELLEMLTARTTTRYKKKHTVLVEHFTDVAQSVGKSLTFNNAVVSDQPEFSDGTEYDQGTMNMMTPSPVAIAAIT